ncbi:hypothetical protein AJ80_07247 [Polytolypa hystricis UAMH7299]|uniref:Uncharacterized protein n=1 Tax=Polytolypa hystricis (strain UAMH7299) TaxID=1447883 RepID=A0A2B7XQB4_POLH7|nr:hypothetical protein AJ80_07247 [Polytolypa hystricis UAMH7299]
MFELPNAKRVRRSELLSPRSSRSPSPIDPATASYAERILRNTFANFSTFTAAAAAAETASPSAATTATTSTGLEHTKDTNDEDATTATSEQEFEFRLFRPTAEKKSKDGISGGNDDVIADTGIRKLKLRLRSPTPLDQFGGGVSGDGQFIVPFRGWGYYFSDPESVMRALRGSGNAGGGAEDLSSMKLDDAGRRDGGVVEVAVSGEEIVELARASAWPGCYLPWRIIHLKPTTTTKQTKTLPSSTPLTLQNPTIPKPPKSHKKPGKKRRIILRKRLAAAKTAEEQDREKRKRRNREKQLKRRQREKGKKAAMRAEGEGEGKSEVGEQGD